MGETGKRGRRDNDGDGKNQKKKANNYENNGDQVIYRIICPDNVIGSVIGKSGKVINSLRHETRAKIKVVERFPGTNKRIVLIYCHDKDKDNKDFDPLDVDVDEMEPLCPAQDALLRVHAEIVNALSSTEESEKKQEEVEILVPSSQAANIIGKQGATIKKLRAKNKANIRVNEKDPVNPTHNCAMSFDNFVTITGDADAVRKALFAVSSILYKFPPKEEISLETDIPQTAPTIIIPSDFPIYPTGSFYPGIDSAVPHRSVPLPPSNAPEFTEATDSLGTWSSYPSAHSVISLRSEELVLRVLCPSDRIGRVIGKGGAAIKSIRQASGTRVEVDDKKDASEECLVTITSTEATHDVKSAAVEAVLLLQEKINDEDDETVNIRLLVPTKVIGCLIGKGGSIINDMRKSTKAIIYISKGEKPKLASNKDELVEITGEVANVRNALLQIVLRLRDDALKDRDGGEAAPVEPSYPVSLSLPPTVQSAPAVAPMSYERAEPGTGHGMLTGSSLYGYSSLQAGDTGYGSLSSYSANAYGGYPSFSEVAIPSHAAGKVIGKSGANLANIRKISGATVEVVDSKTSRSERIARISGTPEQKRTAENLIQAFILAA